MKFFVVTSVLSFLAVVVMAQKVKGPGPSGKLLKPTGGETFAKGAPVEYQHYLVDQSEAKTNTITLDWEGYPNSKTAPFEKGVEIDVPAGGVITGTKIITSSLPAPTSFCGNVSLLYTERRLYRGDFLVFHSAPTLNILC